MESDPHRVKLSKAVLEMKFMKKTKERFEKEDERVEGQEMYRSEITDDMKRGGKYVLTEVGINVCLDLLPGRMSFGGMNPEVERYMAEYKARRKQEKVEKEKESDISDLEMAKKLYPAEKRSRKEKNKRKFIKPVDSD